MKESPARIAAAQQAIEAAGGKVKGSYLLMGEYDILTIIEGPDDETAATLALAIGAQGNIRTQTMPAFTAEEFGRIVDALP